ncbi:MAG: carbon-nitrogen hydrolase family protein [Clostridiales bacterium]|nr:carbon-nitrogen hydrolase family protein [Clostridiales bacterium]
MKLAMAQMSMTENKEENLAKTLTMIRRARGCDVLFFPEIQLCPFFPQYPGGDASAYLMEPDGPEVRAICAAARENHLYVSPNLYLSLNGKAYDASAWIDPDGKLVDISKMVHIAQALQFCEQDYYTPSDDGFKVYETPWGKVGIVICFDRHLPESIRTATLKGADLILIPTANTRAEPMEMFEWEVRVQAMQNSVFAAMCNRVGIECDMDFCGQSLIADPDGNLVLKADYGEELYTAELDLSAARRSRQARPYLSTRRPALYI